MTEVVLGDELIKQVETMAQYNITEPNTENQLKFDAKGTLHVMHRDSDGKLLRDIPVKSDITSSILSRDNIERLEECETIRETVHKQNVIFNILLISIGVITLASILLLRSMV